VGGDGVVAPDLLSISEVGEATGLQSSALRYYEKSGLIRPAARAGGRRHYHPSVLQRLAAIALLQEAGFTIAEVGQLLGTGTSQQRWRSMAEQKLKEIDAHVARVAAARELLISALRCDCSGLDTCELVSARRGRHQKVLQRLSPPSRVTSS
jgi:MerR family transcriptional regulator, redox-sensitive transcriptional activator SoxR